MNCVDSCPPTKLWQCEHGNCTQSKFQGSTGEGYRSVFGYCVANRPTDLSDSLKWAASKLTRRQLGLVANFTHSASVFYASLVVLVFANILLCFMIRSPASSKFWTLTIFLLNAIVIVTFLSVILFDVYGVQHSTPSNSTSVVKVAPELHEADSSSMMVLFASYLFIALPLVIVFWLAFYKSKPVTVAILTFINENLLSSTILTRIQIFTILNSIVSLNFSSKFQLIFHFSGNFHISICHVDLRLLSQCFH